MKIGIIGSMQYSDQMVESAEKLKALGHTPMLSLFVESFLGKDAIEQERIKLAQKNDEDAMRKDIKHLKKADAILVLNIEKHGIPGYIGGNSFLEMGAAYLNRKPIYLMNPIPEIPYYKTEIEAMKPDILNGDLTRIS